MRGTGQHKPVPERCPFGLKASCQRDERWHDFLQSRALPRLIASGPHNGKAR